MRLLSRNRTKKTEAEKSTRSARRQEVLIEGGLAAPGLLAWVGVCKFADHLPLYRIEQITARQGVPITRSTLAAWIGRIGVALQPLSDRLAELLRQRPCLHADETPVRQLDPGAGKTKTAYLWAYRSNDFDTGLPIVVFDYQTGRAGAHARAFLEGWQGHLMVDDFAGYKNNPAENAVRPIVLGKKNWLFAGSERAGRRAAAIQSLLATAKLNGLEPLAWLADTLAKLPTCQNSQIDSLLPLAQAKKD